MEIEVKANCSFPCLPQQKTIRSDIDRDEALGERWVDM